MKLPTLTKIRCTKNSYGEFDDDHAIGPGQFADFDLIHVRSGEVRLLLMEKDEVQLSSGQAVLIYPETPVHGETVTPSSQISVHHFRTLDEQMRHMKAGYECFLRTPLSLVERDIHRIVRLAEQEASPGADEVRAGIMTTILAQFQLPDHAQSILSATADHFGPLVSWLEENLGKAVDVSAMATRMGLSNSHFRRLFKAEFGVAPGKYFLELRLAEAQRQLRETLEPIKVVAFRVGYRDVAHFYRAFSMHYGLPPGRYRQANRPTA